MYISRKLKLILSGFHEGALAARACFKLARPNEKYRFEFTTSSKTIKNRLGVKRVIELFSSETPNTRKISIMLEEIGFDYKVTKENRFIKRRAVQPLNLKI